MSPFMGSPIKVKQKDVGKDGDTSKIHRLNLMSSD